MPQLATLAPLASALADPVRLRVYALVVVGGAAGVAVEELRAAEPTAVRQLTRLAQAGLLELLDDGARAVARASAFADAMHAGDDAADSEQAEVAKLFKDGRLVEMPVRPARRRALLEYLTRRVFEPGVSYGEREVNIALRQYWDDPSALRRYLIQAQLLTRSADGSDYRVAAAGPA